MDTQPDEGNELGFLIEQEQKLANVPVTVVVDRSYAAEPRNLRWDVLPIPVSGGVQHAKVTVLAWEGHVRLVVSSANLVEHSYRSNLETATVLDANADSSLPEPLFLDLIDEVLRIVNRAPQPSGAPGPKKRAAETLRRARQLTKTFELPSRFPRRGASIHVIGVDSNRPALSRMRELLGGTASSAAVLSPFFDVGGAANVAGAELAKMMSRGNRPRASFVLPASPHADRMLVSAPRELRDAFPSRVATEFRPVESDVEDRGRRLHAKAMLLERDERSVALVGSSNFTAAGLGINGRGNLEINLAFRIPTTERRCLRALRGLFRAGPVIPEAEIDWEAAEDEETPQVELPAGFVDFLLDARRREVAITLKPSVLPDTWSVYAQGAQLCDQADWEQEGRPSELVTKLADRPDLPFFVEVRWGAGERLPWPLNVRDPGALPPPEELRTLPLDLLIEALSSTQPLHRFLEQEKRRRKRLAASPKSRGELDPLSRYAGTGRLLQRARRLSLAFEGIVERLERPAASPEALEWRLFGPVGPLALAKAIVKELDVGDAIIGEKQFMLAELALSMSRVDWSVVGAQIGKRRAREQGLKLIAELESMAKEPHGTADGRKERPEGRQLRGYVKRAFSEARQ